MKTKITIIMVMFLFSAFFGSRLSFAATQYELTDLGYLLRPWAINESTKIAGSTESYPYSNFYWDQGVTTYFGVPTTTGHVSFAYDINETGRVVGLFNDCYWISGCQDQAMYWDHGTPNALGAGRLSGVNDANQMVGSKYIGSSYDYRAALWQADGTSQDLGTLGGTQSFAMKINNAGHIIGLSDVAPLDATQHAVLWANGSILDLGTLGGTNSMGMDINNHGIAVGLADTLGGGVHTFLWNGSEMIDIIPGFSTIGFGLNDHGQVVGSLDYQGSYLWEKGHFSNLQDLVLNDNGWTLNQAFDINNQGQIVGIGTFNGGAHGYLLSPVLVPEPPSAFLLLIGGLGLVFLRRSIVTQKQTGSA